jgi:hypothetical protein
MTASYLSAHFPSAFVSVAQYVYDQVQKRKAEIKREPAFSMIPLILQLTIQHLCKQMEAVHLKDGACAIVSVVTPSRVCSVLCC